MAFAVKVLADSLSPAGVRLTTLEVTFCRYILAEVNTHRALSRNSASSRAIPVKKQLAKVWHDPYVPIHWGQNQSGMQAHTELRGWRRQLARLTWLGASKLAVLSARALLALGLHKQVTNRLLEPFMWHTAIISATDWSNMLALRDHEDAQPEFRVVAGLIKGALAQSTPKPLALGEWHLPLVPDLAELQAEHDIETIVKIAVGRCARVSYLTHDGVRDTSKDIELCERLVASGHMSPTEHVATPGHPALRYGNFRGWRQMRQEIPNEHDFALVQAA